MKSYGQDIDESAGLPKFNPKAIPVQVLGSWRKVEDSAHLLGAGRTSVCPWNRDTA